MISLLRGPTCLVVHNVDQAAGSMLKEPNAFGVVEVRNVGDVVGNSFSRVLRKVVLEKTFLDEVLESFVGEIDTELVERVGAAGHVLWSGKIEQTNESDEIVAT
jgi:hypothetical protein